MNNIDEFSELKALKPWARFDVGDLVYLKSDIKRKAPMTIVKTLPFDDDDDYSVNWMNSQRTLEQRCLPDNALMD